MKCQWSGPSKINTRALALLIDSSEREFAHSLGIKSEGMMGNSEKWSERMRETVNSCGFSMTPFSKNPFSCFIQNAALYFVMLNSSLIVKCRQLPLSNDSVQMIFIKP